MTDTPLPTSASSERNDTPSARPSGCIFFRWRFCLGCLGVLAVIAILAVVGVVLLGRYFTSDNYFQKNLRPEIEKMLGGRSVQVAFYEFSPFNGIHLKNVEIGPLPGDTDKSPVLKLSELDVKYNLLAMRNNRIEISKVLVDTLTVKVKELANGTLQGPFPTLQPSQHEGTPSPDRNAPGLKFGKEKEAAKSSGKIKPGKQPKPLVIDISNVEIKNVNLYFDIQAKGKEPAHSYALENFSKTCPHFSLNAPFQAEVKGKLRADDITAQLSFSPQATIESGRLVLRPSPLKLEAANGKTLLHVDIGMEMDTAAQTGKLDIKLHPADKNFLNLFSGATGINFRDTTVSGAWQIELDHGNPTSAQGALDLASCNPVGKSIPQNLPPLDLKLQMESKMNAGVVDLKQFKLTATRADGSKDKLAELGITGMMKQGKKAAGKFEIKAPLLQIQPFLPQASTPPVEAAPALNATALAAEVSFDNNGVEVKNFTVGLAGGNIALKTFTLRQDVAKEPLMTWEGLQVSNLDIKTLAANLAPAQQGKLDGKANAQSTGSARGFSLESILKDFRANLTASIASAAPQASPLLNLEIHAGDGGGAQPGKMEIKLAPVDKRILNLAAAASGIDFRDTTLAADIQIALDKGAPTGLQGKINILSCNPAGKSIPPGMPAADWQITLDSHMNSGALDVKSLAVNISRAGQAGDKIATLEASGPVKLGAKTSAQLQVKSPRIQAQPLLPLGGIQPAPGAPALNIDNLALQVAYEPAQIQINDFTAGIAGGKITLKSFLMRPETGKETQLRWNELQARDLDVDTLLANLAPAQRGKLTGKANAQSTGAAQGFSEEAMEKALRANATATIVNGELKEIPLLDEIAQATTIPDLRKIVFSKFDSEIVAGEKNIAINRCFILGDNQKINASGTMNYDTSLKVPLSLGLGGKLKENVGKQKFAQLLKPDPDGYMMFPTPLLISGKAAKPKVKLDLPKEAILKIGTELLQKQMDKKNKDGQDTGSTQDQGGEKKNGKSKTNPLDLLKGFKK